MHFQIHKDWLTKPSNKLGMSKIQQLLGSILDLTQSLPPSTKHRHFLRSGIPSVFYSDECFRSYATRLRPEYMKRRGLAGCAAFANVLAFCCCLCLLEIAWAFICSFPTEGVQNGLWICDGDRQVTGRTESQNDDSDKKSDEIDQRKVDVSTSSSNVSCSWYTPLFVCATHAHSLFCPQHWLLCHLGLY